MINNLANLTGTLGIRMQLTEEKIKKIDNDYKIEDLAITTDIESFKSEFKS